MRVHLISPCKVCLDICGGMLDMTGAEAFKSRQYETRFSPARRVCDSRESDDLINRDPGILSRAPNLPPRQRFKHLASLIVGSRP